MGGRVRRTQATRSAETSGRILQAAQKLFAERGFDGVTMRAIAAEADVNLASIVYYFDNKEGLYLSVFRHYAEPLKEMRMERLREVDQNPNLEGYVRAFIEPAFLLLTDESLGGPDHARLLWRVPQEPKDLVQRIYNEFYAPVLQEMTERIKIVCPWDNEMEYSWHAHVMSSIFHATLGKYSTRGTFSTGFPLDAMWMNDRDAVMDMVVRTAILLLSHPMSEANTSGH